MKRRDFCKTTSVAIAGLAGSHLRPSLPANAAEEFPQAPGLTKYVCEFILNTNYDDIPGDVAALGKKSILEGLDWRSRDQLRVRAPGAEVPAEPRMRRAGQPDWDGHEGVAPLRRVCQRGSIHADDFDDTQLSASARSCLRLLTHPTVTVLPPAFASVNWAAAAGKI